MKIRKILLSVSIIFGFIFIACNNGINNENQEKEKETGSISGKVLYSNLDESHNAGIIVTLDKTDGLRTESVMRSAVNRSIVTSARTIVSNSVTKDDGSYLFENLEPGTYTVYAASSYSKEKAVCTNVVVRSAEETVADVMTLTATGSIKGKITLDEGNSGNTGFLVFIAGTSYMAITDDAGNYTISDVPAGSGYQFVAMKNNVMYFLEANVVVNANSSTTIATNNFTSKELKASAGKDGVIGTSIVWLGSFKDISEIKNPKYLNAYFNMEDGCSYIYNGTKWTLLSAKGDKGDKGDSGNDGTNGTNGVSIVWKGEFSDVPVNPELNWAYYNTETGCSYIWNGTKWDLLSKVGANGSDGENGTNGTDGVSIVWKGEQSEPPKNPELNWAYYNTETGCSYIWNGNNWNLLAKSGTDPECLSGSLSIGTIFSSTNPTNENIVVTLNISKTEIEKTGYVYSKTHINWNNAKSVLTSPNFIPITKSSDGKYTITASENGYYTFVVMDFEGFIAYRQDYISNIDKNPPEKV
ncbi:MAG: hypothetical protein J5710_14970, partial [Treponema sp.]|nr:hypothetical protein [Treponema sp.]